MAGIARVNTEENELLVADVDRSISPERRNISDGAWHYLYHADLTIMGLREQVASPAQAKVDFSRALSAVEVPLGHVILVADLAGLNDACAVDQLPFLMGDVHLVDLAKQGVTSL